MPNVRIEDEAFGDPRIETLGVLAGYNRFEALGRLAHLWHTCTRREAYILSEAQIRGCLGERGPDAIVEADLGERVAGGIRVKGTEGRIEWLQKLRASAKAGGEANKRRIAAKQLDSHCQATAEPSGYPSGSCGEPQPSQVATQVDSLLASQTEAKAEPKPSPSSSSSSSSSSETPTESCSEAAKAPPSEPLVLSFPVVGRQASKEWHLTESKLAEYRESFPGVDVLAEVRAARQWCVDNTTRRKTPGGMPRFISAWLTRAQNAPRLKSPPSSPPSKPLLDPSTAPPMPLPRRKESAS